jgi:hypothetical protein
MAEAVGKGARRKEGAGEGKTIGVDDPGQAGNAQSNVFRDGGHRHHDRRHIEQYQEGAQAKSERRQDRPPLLDRATGRVILHSSFAFYCQCGDQADGPSGTAECLPGRAVVADRPVAAPSAAPSRQQGEGFSHDWPS